VREERIRGREREREGFVGADLSSRELGGGGHLCAGSTTRALPGSCLPAWGR
jgi:hypothetical protein